MNTNLFIGSIPYTATSEDLRSHFSQAGNVEEATIIMDKMTGRSRGFGFVRMASSEEAQNAIDMLNEKEFMGRVIYVSEAKEREQR